MKKSPEIIKKSSKNGKNGSFLNKISIFINKNIFPDNFKCIFCGCDIPNFYNKPYCEKCEKLLPFISKNCCLICSNEIGNEQEICDFCQTHHPAFKKLFAPFRYEGIVKKSILSFKFDNARFLAKGYALIMCKQFKDLSFDYVTFVPMTKAREKERSFNQSKMLAVEISKILNIPCLEIFSKNKETKPQKSLSYKERIENVKDAFSVTQKVTNKRILLVDDVASTCATLNACTKMLKDCEVYATAIARNIFKC